MVQVGNMLIGVAVLFAITGGETGNPTADIQVPAR
jgi:hypothetical protein